MNAKAAPKDGFHKRALNLAPGPDDGLPTFANCMWGMEPPGTLVNVRWKLRRGAGMAQEFIDVRDPRLVPFIRARGVETDAYARIAPCTHANGGRESVRHAHAVWVDIDGPEALERLRAFRPRPALVVSSGSPSAAHAYWPLWPPVGPDDAERANRRLAHHLGADMRATDAARILRPPGTMNHKHDPARPVELVHMEVEVFTLEQVVADLADPPELSRRRETLSAPTRFEGGDSLAAIPPDIYVEALTGQQVGRDGKIRCPLPGHDDRTPSTHVYPDAERGWFCYGCGKGGTVYDLAAALWGIDPRGDGFREIRERLARELLPHLEGLAA